ncbi:hypothetical protein GEV43_11095 [Actinomadura sp. J1-007]|uniref:hypothetical protein n=1 Tax=Actinomadura sp. J1-007 TaxID=2661913 RepID=UPI001324120F|nr:hypothetical protein [Actinomadura sp. J1-007]MWK34535.1 hypothetical protein [Actinomadura sp. J1-007]
MPPLPQASPPASSRHARGTRRGFAVPALGLAAVLVAVAGLWLAGGLDEAEQEPEARPGQAIDTGWFTVTVRDARIAMASGPFGGARQRYLVVRLRAVSKGKETALLENGGLVDGLAARTKAGKWVRPDQVRGVAGGAQTRQVQPGLPVEASAMWRMGPSDAPKRFTVRLLKWEWDEGFSDDEFRWRIDPEDGSVAGRLTLPVAAMPAAAPSTPAPRVRPGTRPRVRPGHSPRTRPGGRATRPAGGTP